MIKPANTKIVSMHAGRLNRCRYRTLCEREIHAAYQRVCITLETMTPIPQLFGGAYRTLLGGYRAAPSSYQDWCSIYRGAKDFRNLERHYLDLGDGALSTVAENNPPVQTR